MSNPASPVLTVSGNTSLTRTRRVPPGATITVERHNRVNATDVVATADVSGQMVSVDAAALLGVAKGRILDYLAVGIGDRVSDGQVIGRRDALMGIFKTVLVSPLNGTVESVSRVSGHLMIRETPHPVTVRAYIGGRVETIDPKNGVTVSTTGALIQGVFGVGGEVTGTLCSTGEENLAGRIVCAFESINAHQLCHFREAGALGVIAPGIDGRSLMDFCGGHLNPAATGDENVGIAMVFTEGFGALPMAVKSRRILMALMNREVSMSGATQVRAGVIRPELIGPPVTVGDDENPLSISGRSVKIIRGPHMGCEARIVDEPVTPQLLQSGIAALTYTLQLTDSGDTISVPRVNVE